MSTLPENVLAAGAENKPHMLEKGGYDTWQSRILYNVYQQSIPKETSYDPFNIYDILNKENKDVNAAATNLSISFPPGFTPDKPDTDVGEPVAQKDQFQPDVKSVGSSSHTVESANNVDDQFSTGSIENIQKKKESGSILEILEEMISSLSLFAELEARFLKQFHNYQQQHRCLQEDREEWSE
nr:hypothetical protein [Tanacetum cinerariifolium]